MAQSEIIKLLQSYVRILNEAGMAIQRAFLFGSYARNEGNADSDIDVLLVSDKIDDDDIEGKTLAWRLTRRIDIRIEPFIVGAKRFFSDDNSALMQEIKKEGVEIII